jgi:hypothetical protein
VKATAKAGKSVTLSRTATNLYNNRIMNEVLKQLQELKELSVLSAKQALTMNDTALLTGLANHIFTSWYVQKKSRTTKVRAGNLPILTKMR